jgi:apolipoprotein N-acyltransferase
MVTSEFVFTLLGGFGAWGSLAYSQASFLPLVQVAAVTGMYGVTFVLAWTASLLNLALDSRRSSLRLSRAALGLAGVVPATVCLAGTFRLLGPSPEIEAVTIATVSPRTPDDANYRTGSAGATQSWLFARSREAARAGADLVVWPEGSFSTLASDEADRVGRAVAFARQEGVALAMPYASRVGPDDPRYGNRMVLIDPAGEILWEYGKQRPVPGMEELMVPGAGPVARAELPAVADAGPPTARPGSEASPGTTPASGLRLAGLICFDADHPELMRQVRGSDLVLVPSDDWHQIVGLHSAMVRLRSIEYGVPIARATLHGESVVYDARGRSLGSLRDDRPHPRILLVDLRTGAEPTLAAHAGSAFPLLAAAGLFLLGLRARRATLRRLRDPTHRTRDRIRRYRNTTNRDRLLPPGDTKSAQYTPAATSRPCSSRPSQ